MTNFVINYVKDIINVKINSYIFMKRLLTILMMFIGSITLIMANDYPDLWLRGEMTNGWACQSDYKFSRNENIYTLSLPSLNGQFKISDGDWNVEYGSNTGSEMTITGSIVFTGIKEGRNLIASNLEDVTITVLYDPNHSIEAQITIKANGEDPKPADYTSGTLPVLYINVYDENGNYDNEVIDRNLSHKNYFKGEYWLDLNGCNWLADEGAKSIGSREEPLPLEIKARGNYTRKAFSKKPFKLKLGTKQSMLGLSKSKHFALLAHADDNKGYLRNFTGFNLGRRIGLPWTPWQQPVEVVINGDYRGLYFLTESIRVEKDRVNIAELNDNETDNSLVSGGYIVELDNYDEENQIRMPEKGDGLPYKDELRITFDTPEEYSDIQKQFITDQFTMMNDLIGVNSNDLWKYLDMDDLARYYLVEEIIAHTEAFHGSTYMFRDRGENQKWHFSPLWDCGNAFNGPDNDFFYYHSPFGATWIPSIRMNAKFNDKVKETWLWFMQNKYSGLTEDIDSYTSRIAAAAAADHQRWKNAPLPDFETPQQVSNNTDMDSRRDDVKGFLQRKINFLREKFGDYTVGTYAEPTRDNTPAASLPEYLSGLSEIDIEEADVQAELIYDLRGMRVKAMTPGEIYIVRCGDKYRKVIAR